ncbi:membrane hypothetical protein [Candidatus Sulfotelmatomonas gaucii]|uniref:Uncharacterized protein n=1 Tax=Candidatus Sulfuritelmatomonas gaucii TaxID=2043161 RepID=A0A2N9LVN0_9BACT|nr:membrane hypothetical protein [Candidatus Sulfotelmatomonas gaucii]
MSDVSATSSLNDLFLRLRSSLAWVAAQFWATLLLILAGVAWTRLPDKHAWQVGLTLLLPILLIVVLLFVQAKTMRNLLSHVKGRTPLVIGTLMLLVWAAVVWLAWWALNWCDDQIPSWAGYLNSRASAHARATVFTYGHIQTWLTLLEWILRWIVIPAKVIPYAIASAQWGWRLPWRRLFGLLLNWRWWLAVVVASLIAVTLPIHFFSGIPHGTVAHQVWAVIFKFAGAYLQAVVCWVLLVAWAAVLFERGSTAAKEPGDDLLVLAPVHSGPLGEDSVRLPLSERSSDAGGNA